MTKKIIKMLNEIEIKIQLEKKLTKKEKDLIRALIKSAVMDLGGVADDNNGTGGTEEA